MSTEIKVPALGESVTTATVARWLKKAGESVSADEPLVELETDKVTVEVNAPAPGTLAEISAAEGAEVEVGGVLGLLDAGAAGAKPAAPKAALAATAGAATQPAAKPSVGVNPPPRPSGPVARPATPPADIAAHAALPAAAKLMEEKGVVPGSVGAGTGKDGRITKGDVLAFLSQPAPVPVPVTALAPAARAARATDMREERVKMTRLRRTIAARLKEAQNTAAMLTTFNEVDMSAVMALRSEYREAFEKKHGGARLGFMSFFVRACVVALREFPAVNAEIDGDEIVYKNFVHMGIAVGGANGLVVPVLREAQDLSFAEIEKRVSDFGRRARDGALKLDELAGGTFSITNGGVYGSLMSTPIINPPQSAILGMHKIQDRPMVVGGEIKIRPMMYLALSYDHRIVDGKEAVSFLVRVKEAIEDPRRLLLELLDEPDPALHAVLGKGLENHNLEKAGYSDRRALSIAVRDAEGNLLGGVEGRTSLGIWFIDLVYLPESMRGLGVGTKMIAMAEAEARKRGCRAAILYTIRFQAPDFYARLGFREFGRIECDPPGNARIFMHKELA
jgi:2-oxoglutarate dehydrogenase E2 component (dihydrolipoamide succinyltransferase)